MICGLNKHTHFLTLFAYRIDANVHKIQNEICMEHILHEKTYNIILLAPKTLNINNLSCQICHHRQVFFNKELYFFLKVIKNVTAWREMELEYLLRSISKLYCTIISHLQEEHINF